MSQFVVIDRILNMYHTVHRARSLNKLISTYRGIDIFRTWPKILDGAL